MLSFKLFFIGKFCQIFICVQIQNDYIEKDLIMCKKSKNLHLKKLLILVQLTKISNLS